MNTTSLQQWIDQNPELAQTLTFIGVLLLIILSYLIAYRLVGRALLYIAGRTVSKYDDIVINRLKPARVSLYVPLYSLFITSLIWSRPLKNLSKKGYCSLSCGFQ